VSARFHFVVANEICIQSFVAKAVSLSGYSWIWFPHYKPSLHGSRCPQYCWPHV